MNDEQINEFRPIVHGIANRIAGRLPAHVDVDDLYSVGFIGLMEAAESFDPSKNVLFKTFAAFRINGAILDHLRELDWVPRSTRAKGKALAAAQASASQKSGRKAEDEDVAAELGIELPEYFELVTDTGLRSFSSLNQTAALEDGHGNHCLDELIGDDVPTAEERLTDLESVTLALGVLTDQERIVIEKHILNGENLKAVGLDLGVTEGRIGQIKGKALKKMQARLAA